MSVTIDGTAIFTCKAVGLITFEVDNQAIDSVLRSQGFDDSSPQVPDKDDSTINTRTLIVYGRIENNGSKISCSVLSTSPPSSARSDEALLLVFELSMIHCYRFFAHNFIFSFCVRSIGAIGQHHFNSCQFYYCFHFLESSTHSKWHINHGVHCYNCKHKQWGKCDILCDGAFSAVPN